MGSSSSIVFKQMPSTTSLTEEDWGLVSPGQFVGLYSLYLGLFPVTMSPIDKSKMQLLHALTLMPLPLHLVDYILTTILSFVVPKYHIQLLRRLGQLAVDSRLSIRRTRQLLIDDPSVPRYHDFDLRGASTKEQYVYIDQSILVIAGYVFLGTMQLDITGMGHAAAVAGWIPFGMQEVVCPTTILCTNDDQMAVDFIQSGAVVSGAQRIYNRSTTTLSMTRSGSLLSRPLDLTLNFPFVVCTADVLVCIPDQLLFVPVLCLFYACMHVKKEKKRKKARANFVEDEASVRSQK
jgi:hypothetical protein